MDILSAQRSFEKSPGVIANWGTGMRMAFAAAAVLAAFAATMVPATAEQLVGSPPQDYGKVVLSDRQAAAGIQLELNVGAYNNEPISGYGDSAPFKRLGRAVGRLDIRTDGGVFPCTAFVISDRHILTNYHCVPGVVDIPQTNSTKIEAVSLLMGYTVEGIADGTERFQVNMVPVEADEDLDFAVLEVFGKPSETFGMLKLAAVDPLPDLYPYWIVGHPMKRAQHISREQCRSDKPAFAGARLRHTCDTLPGNSGSPVIDPESRAAVALHHAGSRLDSINFAIPIALIAQKSPLIAGLVQEAAAAPTVTARVPDVAASAGAEAARFFALIQNSEDPSVLRAFIRQYPSSDEARQAEVRLAALDATGTVEAPTTATPSEAPEIAALRGEANGGDALAMRAMGLKYQIGDGVAQDRDRALRWFGKAAAAGNAAAMNDLGLFYARGEGVEKDLEEAFRWHHRAADRGVVSAMFNVAVMLEHGKGVAEDDAQAVKWYKKAVENDHLAALFNLAVMTLKGEGTPADSKEALSLMRRAADGGNADAMYAIGWFYSSGQGVPKDLEEATRWYRQAAANGHGDAAYNLGMMHANGQGVPRDLEAAAQLIIQALSRGSRPLAMNRPLRQALQAELSARALYAGPVDGSNNDTFKRALKTLRETAG